LSSESSHQSAPCGAKAGGRWKKGRDCDSPGRNTRSLKLLAKGIG